MPSFLAVYKLHDAGVMKSTGHTSKAGRRSVKPRFSSKMTNWDHDLVLSDIDNMDVPADGGMVPIDRLMPDSPLLPEAFTPLEIVGLDATIA